MVDATRAWGWMGLMAAQLYICLEDRTLAEAIKERFRARVQLYIGAAGGRDLWGVSPNDHNEAGELIGPASEVWTAPLPTPFPSFILIYQQAWSNGGLQIAGEVLDIPEARDLALLGARGVLAHAYDPDGTEWEILGVLPDGTTPAERVLGRGAQRTGDFAAAWLPLAPWVVLRHDPSDARARFLYDLARSKALAGAVPCDWIAPLAAS
jgi:hypothetical protein